MQTAKALGLAEEEIFNQPMMPEFRGKLDFKRALLYEGTIAEWYASSCTEERTGHWAGQWFRALTAHYGLSEEEAVYFSTHHEADLVEHEQGVMGHGKFNRIVLQRLIEDGLAEERFTYGMEYCALASVHLHALLLNSCMNTPQGNE